MSVQIKVEQPVYDELQRLKLGRQTFSDVIEHLLKARLDTLTLLNQLEGSLGFREWQRDRLQEISSKSSIAGLGVNTGDDESP